MKQLKWIFLALFVGQQAYGQEVLPLVYDTLSRNQEITVSGGLEWNTTAIPNSFTTFFIRGGEIPDTEIETTLSKHKQLNRIGAYAQPELVYSNYNLRIFKKKPWGLQVKAGMLLTGAGRYTDGAFGLLFEGNERYLGTKANLSNTVFNAITAQKLGFGLVDQVSKSSVTLNVYGIQNYLSGYLNESYLQQDSTGYDAELMLNGTFERAVGQTYYQGIGVGVDASFILKMQAGEQAAFLQFQVQNLGVGFLTAPVARYNMDTTLYYSGLELEDVAGEETVFNDETELMDEIGLQRDTIYPVVALPFTIQVAKIIDEHNQNLVQAFYGVRVYGQNGAIPLVFAGAQLRPTDWLRIGASLSYGGFTKLRGGLYVQARFDHFNLGVSTNNVIGMVSKSGLGHAYSFSMSYRL